ncbi:MAG: carboxypeptidase regulatory-like domain-containing protein [Acidobacteria bacterium]|nr:carboxypeptidase regulatory-like domain-containing protein [Acidobacteriota bacterium]
MRHESALWSVGLALALAGTAACGADGDTRPFTVVGPTASVPSGRLTVTNGWTGAPVPQARVTLGAETVLTDAAGQFVVDTSAPCQRTTVVASGYLDRRMNCLPPATRQGPAAVTLWPVADEAERAALQTFAFRGSGQTLVQPFLLEVEIHQDTVDRDAVVAAWQRAGNTVATKTAGTATLRLEPLREDGVLVTPWSSPANCAADTPILGWLVGVAGFCPGASIGYFAHHLHVAPSLIDDESVALRALLFELGLRPHPLPGLMNIAQPADTLSDFETRTLHMMSLRVRRYPQWVAWPDVEY